MTSPATPANPPRTFEIIMWRTENETLEWLASIVHRAAWEEIALGVLVLVVLSMARRPS
ncbi:hypothetical protein SCE1572_05065 [Sorangium cellulosum So0157-2]|uniref:Uncharacterized protein n=1 Tax=Sorangium cellulosum So0157-2 TaxID=1254432 RepID=S4XL77_SORCE|nr:hypothetical protein SCE1572_05065 [Sorangium cellulosum So0157-2]